MKYSYVPDVLNSAGTLVACVFDTEQGKPGWVDQDPALLSKLSLGDYLLNYWLPAIELEVEPTTFRQVLRGHLEDSGRDSDRDRRGLQDLGASETAAPPLRVATWTHISLGGTS